MNIFTKLTGIIREVINIDAHIDTDAAERSIRGNIKFQGPNALILVKVQTDTLMTESTMEQFRKWISVRLQIENIEIDNNCMTQIIK